MKKYKSHKTVEAFKISVINGLQLVGTEGESQFVSTDYLEKHEPQPGGYYVRYADGYESFSPAEAFEGGYVELEQHDKVTLEMISDQVVDEQFHTFLGTTLTICCLTLKNGFTVTGESACADPNNFDAELGKQYARENAIDHIWKLEGYRLRQQLHEQGR